MLTDVDPVAQAIDRRERLRRLAMETIDLAKDPYYMRNHLGQIECRLCLTIHPNEGNYLAHTQVGRTDRRFGARGGDGDNNMVPYGALKPMRWPGTSI